MCVSDVGEVGDYLRVDEEDKIGKGIKEMDQIMGEGKKLLSEEGVINIDEYNKERGKRVGKVFMMIDKYERVKE
ncbi:hypothetical protein, partial [Staphylococcus epidermidis]|uniref:hypothetical protein n=1 Tax=Staphylococcus epidermidis TaxID=1282 RepID=UPI001C92CF89